MMPSNEQTSSNLNSELFTTIDDSRREMPSKRCRISNRKLKFLAFVTFCIVVGSGAVALMLFEPSFRNIYNGKIPKILTRYLNFLNSTTDSCEMLLMDGNFTVEDGKKFWKPTGCSMHYYLKKEAKLCMKKQQEATDRQNWFLFIGDSRILTVFHDFSKIVGLDTGRLEHRDYMLKNSALRLKSEFRWQVNVTTDTERQLFELENLHPIDRPRVLVLGVALWSIRDARSSQSIAIEEYRRNLTLISPHLENLHRFSIVLWRIQYPIVEHIQQKLNYWQFVKNEVIDKYNEIAARILYDKVNLWLSSKRIGEELMDDYADAYHAGLRHRITEAQILYNYYCNKVTSRREEQCCSGNHRL